MTREQDRCDVAVMGGAIMGSSVAYFLKRFAPSLSVCVIEPDLTYEFCSTVRASGGARRLFSCPENIEMSNFSIQFIKQLNQEAAESGESGVDWVNGGYLFIVPPKAMRVLESNYNLQRRHGCEVNLLTRTELKEHFPSMFVEDLGGGVHSPGDGWCDPNGLLQIFRKKAISLGVRYIEDRVVDLERGATAVAAAKLESGGRVVADFFVNAAGAWSAQLCKMVKMPLPVAPLRRFEHYFTAGSPVEPLPYVKDMERLAFRSEGRGFCGGLVDSHEPRGFNFEVDHTYFERVVWPAVAHRFPAFEAARCHRTWSGLYEQCELDGNPIIGNWKGRLENFFVVAGFSGHGMMHAPAAGRAVAELIVHGAFQSIDLAAFGYGRVEKGEPYPEVGIL